MNVLDCYWISTGTWGPKKMIHLKKVRNFDFVSLLFFHICLDDIVNLFPNIIAYVINGWFLEKETWQ